jgi:hypothetical protein
MIGSAPPLIRRPERRRAARLRAAERRPERAAERRPERAAERRPERAAERDLDRDFFILPFLPLLTFLVDFERDFLFPPPGIFISGYPGATTAFAELIGSPPKTWWYAAVVTCIIYNITYILFIS